MTGAVRARPVSHASPRPLGAPQSFVRSYAVRVWAIRIGVIAVFLAAWKLTGVFGILNPVFIGSPEGTVREFFLQFAKPALIGMDLGYTVAETLIGFVIGSLSGMLAAVILFRAPAARQAVAPLIIAANSLPRVALAPLFVLWFGLGIAGKAALVVSLVFFVMLTTTLAGLTQPNKDFEYLARSLGAGRRQHIFYFIVPAAVPTIVAGLELSLTYSFLGAVAGEIVGGSYGIGVRLTAFANSFEIDKFMALLLLLVIMSTATVQLMRHFTAKLTRWHATEQGGAQ
jgi:NitT/TauT family transport system permease protein